MNYWQVRAESPQEVGAVSAFEMVHQDHVVGKLVAFDRLIFKGQCATRAHAVSGCVGRRTS